MTTRRRSLATLAAFASGVALISAQPGDMAARIRAEGQQRSRALALFRTLTDDIGARLTGSPAHMRAARWARRSLRGMGPRQPAPRAVRVRPRLAARAAVGGDDRTAVRSAHRVRRRVVAVNQRRAERTRGVRRRQDRPANRGDGRAASRRHRADAPSAGRVRRPRPAAARPRRSHRCPRATRRCRRRGARRRPPS